MPILYPYNMHLTPADPPDCGYCCYTSGFCGDCTDWDCNCCILVCDGIGGCITTYPDCEIVENVVIAFAIARTAITVIAMAVISPV